MRLKITDAGFARLVNPPNTGTNAVLITQIGLTSTAFTPSAGLTALPGEIKRVASFGGQAVGDDTVHVTIRDDSATAYTLRGFGLYLADGTLFATYGQADPIMEKSAASMLLLATDTRFAEVDTALIQFGDAGFLYPPSTTEVVGVVELATSTEAEDATDTQRAVTPRGVRAYTDKRFGASAPTALAKTLLSATTATAARTALELKSAALKDTGHGNGLDADTLDGKHASEFALAGDFATVGHKHVIADVTGLQEAINDKANLSRNDFRDQQFIGGTYPLLGFGKYGAESAYIGAWDGKSVWRSWNAGRTAAGELTIAHNDVPRWNGSAMWHAGNFAPDTKMDKTGGTFTGHVGVNGNSLRSYGWNGVANDGVLVLGDANSYIFKNGSNFTFANAAGGYTAMLNAGGTVWTSGNFDPASKVSKAGDTMTGELKNLSHITAGPAASNKVRITVSGDGYPCIMGTNPAVDAYVPMNYYGTRHTFNSGIFASGPSMIRAAGDSQPGIRFHSQTLNGYPRTTIEAVTGDSSSFAEMHAISNGFHFYNPSLRRGIRMSNAGQVTTSPESTNPGTGITGFGFTSEGSFGGGFGMLDNSMQGGWWMAAGTMQWGISTYPNSMAAAMTLGGNGVLTTSGGYDFGSSRKLKNIEGTLPYGLAAVERMELAAGHYKPEYNDDGRRRLFFVAEQLAELVPEAVDLEGVEFQGERVASVKLDQLLPVLAKAIQELSAEVRALKAER
ncbi:MAG: tail fiber domain-containing protein [Stenotrophomonas maltophilia]|uniref:tail fiber domain-containing protein n=1 Tax=Stenotrophomonas TaxID=40323 RepID=UPI00131082B3|nr:MULTISPECIES: tail fiber domain-containing protein [Stenotrophomonas]MBS4800455.1 tail fiber domain-containing protein [Stenotrophomonas maltophilia]MDG9986974.1 tail fiber domain-containing protein [Stenotrophomonas sp. GD04024]